jgi:hypothetical protein
MKTTAKAAFILSCAVCLSAGCGGGGAKLQARSTTTTTTVGQELMDLEQAYKQGIIDQGEYQQTKRLILERYQQ